MLGKGWRPPLGQDWSMSKVGQGVPIPRNGSSMCKGPGGIREFRMFVDLFCSRLI